jgi:hypothetical protein
MNNQAITHALLELEAVYPVDAWTVNGFHVWPIVRSRFAESSFHLNARLKKAAAAGAAGSSGTAIASENKILAAAKDKLRAAAEYREARRIDGGMDDAFGPRDVVLYSDGVSFLESPGGYYERFCDPLREVLAERGVSSVMWTPFTRRLVPRASPSVFVQPHLDAVQIANRLALPVLRAEADAHLPGAREAMAFIAERGGVAFSEDDIVKMGLATLGYARAYEAMLRRTNPRAVYIVCYYGLERMALNVACRRLGIPSVDIQHGSSGRRHWAYGLWTRVPEAGYDSLPSHFWCWDQGEADAVNEWAKELPNTPHLGVRAGNLLLDRWLEGTLPFAAHDDEQVRKLVESVDPGRTRRHVLITPTAYQDADSLRALTLSATRLAKAVDCFFWLRTHPVHPELRGPLERAFRDAAIENFDIENATRWPLYALLRFMDVHLTESSTVSIEARRFGVPSVMTSEGESLVFEDLLENGWARLAPRGMGGGFVAETIRAQLDAREALQNASRESDDEARQIVARGRERLLGLAAPNRQAF